VPERYGSYTTCYIRFVRWPKAGDWDHLLGEISKGYDGDLIMSEVPAFVSTSMAQRRKRDDDDGCMGRSVAVSHFDICKQAAFVF